MNKQRASTGANRPQAVSTDFDDWETDPDYVRDMDEMDQRWGAKRTVGSINMNDLIDQVNREHKLLREKFQHPSQRLSSFTADDIKKSSRDPVRGYEETMSKHSSSQEISRKVYTSKGSSDLDIRDSTNSPNERSSSIGRSSSTEKPFTSPTKPTIASKPDFINFSGSSTSPFKTGSAFSANTEPYRFQSNERTVKNESNSSPSPFKETVTTKRLFKEERSTASSSGENLDSVPNAFKSIQDKIDAFKREFEDIENKVNRKSDISKVIKKTSNNETCKQSGPTSFVARNSDYAQTARVSPTHGKTTSTRNGRPDSASPLYQASTKSPTYKSSSPTFEADHLPKADIKGLSKRFETMCRESDDEFKRRTEAKRREFFDQIKHQVRETRKNLDGFDTIDEDLLIEPKVYTRCETTKEEVVSKVVKENDKIIENETKRNIERSSSCHGSSDDENEPRSIKIINQQLRETSPVEYTRKESPIDQIKRKIPFVEPEIKGAGLMARALYDYQAGEDDELSFDVDDLITNIEKVSKEWYRGTLAKAGKRVIGLFPANYVKLLNDSSEY